MVLESLFVKQLETGTAMIDLKEDTESMLMMITTKMD